MINSVVRHIYLRDIVSVRLPCLIRAGIVVTICCLAHAVTAGEISGLPPHLAPTIVPDYQFFLGNDFAAIGTSDDFRTEQMIVSGRFGDNWLATIDHSIMTREDLDESQRARIDTATVAVGYEFLVNGSASRRSVVAGGIALRAVGNFEGERMQNGFHRLIGSDTESFPYTDTRDAAPAAWGLAQHYHRFRRAADRRLLPGWNTGYWARAGLFAATNGQFDAVAGVYGVASRGPVDLWLGLRRDWRSGYGADFVLQETAAQEDSFAVSLGARFGALVFETVQRIDSSASYGQLSFIAAPALRGERESRAARGDLQASLQLPQVTFQLAGRWYRRILTGPESVWREALLAEVRGGEPQLGRDPSLFVETTQLSFGMEWSRPFPARSDRLRFYVNGGAGLRYERLLGREQLLGEASSRIGRAVLAAESGFEVYAARLSANSRLHLRLGVAGWLPASDATVTIDSSTATLQQSGAAIIVAWVVSLL